MEFLIFITGLLVGAMLSLTLFLGYVYFALRGKNPVQRAMEKIESSARPKARVFVPPTEEEEAQQEIMKRNEKRGADTFVEDLGI